MDFLDLAVELEGRALVIIERHRRTEVHPDIKGFGGGKDHRYRVFKAILSNLLTIYPESIRAAGAPAASETSSRPTARGSSSEKARMSRKAAAGGADKVGRQCDKHKAAIAQRFGDLFFGQAQTHRSDRAQYEDQAHQVVECIQQFHDIYSFTKNS